MRLMLSRSTEAISVSTSGVILYANDAFCALVGGLSDGDVIGQATTQFFPVAQPADPSDEPPTPSPHVLRRLDGRFVAVDTTSHDVPYGPKLARMRMTRRRGAIPSTPPPSASQEFLQLALDAAGIANWEWWPETGAMLWSDQMYDLMGVARGEVEPRFELIREATHPDDIASTASWAHEFTTFGVAPTRRFRIIRADGAVRTIFDQAAVVPAPTGGPTKVVGTSQDITDQLKVQVALESSETTLGVLAANSPSMISVFRGSNMVYANPAMVEVTGYSEAELSSMAGLSTVHPDDRALVRERETARRATEEVAPYEFRIVTKSGETRWVELIAAPLRIEGDAEFVVELRDLTEQRQAEASLANSRDRLRALAAGTWEAAERERKAVAREIHDELGQLLTAQKMDVAWLARHLGDVSPDIKERLASLDALASSAINSVRRIASSLRPPLLDDGGLVAAMDWHIRDFEHRSGIVCQARLPEHEPSLSPEHTTAVYRVLQEALTNVARHAGECQTTVQFDVSDEEIRLTVRDDGIGISLVSLLRDNAVGLIGMRERAEQAGGELEIHRRHPKGTTISLRLPRA